MPGCNTCGNACSNACAAAAAAQILQSPQAAPPFMQAGTLGVGGGRAGSTPTYPSAGLLGSFPRYSVPLRPLMAVASPCSVN